MNEEKYWTKPARTFVKTLIVNPVKAHAPMGSTIQVAYEPQSQGFAFGVVFPDGEPWIFESRAATLAQLEAELASAFVGRNIVCISIDEYNHLKRLYEQRRR
jgi:hypothetical protein